MKFNLSYGNHSYQGVHIADTLRLIKYSLQSLGHTVSISPRMEPGQNNIIIENFTYDFVVTMENLRKVPGTRFIILATEYISDQERFNYFPDNTQNDQSHYGQDSLWQKRWKTFCLATRHCDAIWHLSEAQVESYQNYFKNIPVGYLPHAYLDELVRVPNTQIIERDIDVLFTGTMTPYREEILSELSNSGLNVQVGAVNTPDHVREDWINRSKLALNLKQNAKWAYPSNSRFFYHLINSSLLLTERCDETCDLDPYVVHCDSNKLVEEVHNFLGKDTHEMAKENLKDFIRERPMKPLIKKLMDTTFPGGGNA